MFRSRHPEVAPAQSNKAAAGNTNKGRMHTGGRERQPESGRRQPEYAKAERAGKPNSKTCSFHASTLVKTQTGYKAIADIKAGDKVLSKNEHNGEIDYKTVTAQYSNSYAKTVYIHIADAADQNQTLIANKIHPFYTNGRWIEAGSLKAGDILETANGEKQTVQSVVIKAEPLKAYNLTVQDFHTYFVKGKGAETDAVWVHNDCDTLYNPNSSGKNPANGQVNNVPNLNGKTADDIKRILADYGFSPKSNMVTDNGWQTFIHADKSRIDIHWPSGRIVRTAAPIYDSKTGKRINKGQRVDFNGNQIPRDIPHNQHPLETAGGYNG